MKGFWRGHAFCATMLDLDPDVLATVLELLNLADLSRLRGVSRALFEAASEEERTRSTMGLSRVVALVEQPSCLALTVDSLVVVGVSSPFVRHMVRIFGDRKETIQLEGVRAVAVSDSRLFVLDEHHVMMAALPQHGLPIWYDAISPQVLDFEEATSLALVGERLLVMDTAEERVVALGAANLQLQMTVGSLLLPMGAAAVDNELYITEMGADRVAVVSLAGVRQRTLQLDAAYGLVAPQGIAALAACFDHEALLVVACERCALVMSTRGIVMQRLLLGRHRLGCVVCDDSHVYVTEYERGRVWRLVVW